MAALLAVFRRKPKMPVVPLPAQAWPWLLLALALVLVPHMSRLPLWLSGLVIVVGLWRGWSAWQGKSLPGRWLLLPLTLLVVAGLFFSFRTLLGRDPGVALLAAMAALKLLESRTARDAQVLIMLGFLLLMSHLLFDQEIPTAIYLFCTTIFLIAAQAVSQRRNPTRGWPELKLAGRMALQAVPIMLILFVLFPRISGPLWGLPKDAHGGLTGLSNSMSPGSIDQLVQSDEVAFRVRFRGQIPSQNMLYWRGPVLWRFYGREWRGYEERIRQEIPFMPIGNPTDYTVTMEPSGEHWLLALDVPGSIPQDAGITGSYQLVRPKRVNERLQYAVRSYGQVQSLPMTDWEHRLGLQMPRDIGVRARALAQSWRNIYGNDDGAIVAAGLRYIREQPFVYTLQPPLLQGDVVDEFLFKTRRGFCEHYAGSFAFLMRAAGIPARVILGYQGGERNGDYLIVRQSDAHAWVEVWLDEQGGWTRIDPTAAVAPVRIEQGIYAVTEGADQLPFMARRELLWLRDVALYWDLMNASWNEVVLAYGPQQQKDFLSGLGFGEVDFREMMIATVVLLCLVGCGAWMRLLWRKHRGKDPSTRHYLRYRQRLQKAGVVLKAHWGPIEISEKAAAKFPAEAHRLRQLGQAYAALLYNHATQQGLEECEHLLISLQLNTR